METNAPKPHICIVGAGISGLRCADILLSQGFKVTILEARSRIGGRICQSNDLGYTVDIGPNWIHAWTDSDEPHPVFKLATDSCTPLHYWNDKQLIFNSEGSPLPAEQTERLSTLLWEIIDEAFKFSEKVRDEDGGKGIPSRDSLQDFIRQRAEDVVPDEGERKLLVQMSEVFGAYVGEPVWKQSLRFAWMEECCGGEEMFVESTFSSILQRAAKPALEKAAIRLNTLVVGVKTPESRLAGQPVIITTSTSETLSFDEVVMTSPLGWLKLHQDVFCPSLPPRLSAAITNISLSQLEKVFITFPRVFWTKGPEANAFPCYTNWLTPEYATDTNPCGWPQEIWDLSTFREPNNHPTILFYIYGDCSRHIVSRIHGKSKAEKTSLVEEFFRPYYSRLPGYSPDDPDCKPKAILATEWLKDELSGFGSYCNFQVGIEEADKDVLVIREGCPDRRLWFCGEHAAPFEECGTVAGAYLSGESIGKKIAAVYEAGA
ncbi:hypothetical protein B0T18DRAFT_420854 [Schizothecium vesticola]|uniref:Amine oxidase domain-containing protein n=1 Tax=Schizothecium vesticola TaxID=314040 RepID=A0AA40BPC8_9PEZI|nr:hypothetical protein B0T18DRAFT_420854 [Schizothecium vesticola]